MHGLIFQELRRYALARAGEQGWDALLQQVGLSKSVYLAFKVYPDEDAVALFKAAAQMWGKSTRAIQEDFGEFLAPNVLHGYRALIRPQWTVLDVIENAERLHEHVRKGSLATPPVLGCQRMDADTVQLTYSSKRQMCGIGMGFIRGIASAMKQPVEVRKLQCMLQGGPQCVFEVRRRPA
jgi:hypothetical protein